jgi:hypothetical protein
MICPPSLKRFAATRDVGSTRLDFPLRFADDDVAARDGFSRGRNAAQKTRNVGRVKWRWTFVR